MPTTKSILILSEIPAPTDALETSFESKGFHTNCFKFDAVSPRNLPITPPKCIVLILHQLNIQCRDVLAQIHAAYSNMSIPVLALVNTVPPLEIDWVDSIILQPCHPAQTVMRASALIRLADMEREISLRLTTLETDFGIESPISETHDHKRLSILFIGKASPEFMVIINALQKKNVSVIAAFTSFTAFDYLYEKTFDAVVMNGLSSNEPAFSVIETMRKNAKLYHVPALLLTDTETFADHDIAYKKGVSDIIDANAPLEETQSRLLEQANFHRTHENLKTRFGSLGGSSSTDVITKLYNGVFFNAHLKRVSAFYQSQNLPTSLCLIRVKYDNPDLKTISLSSGYKQVGQMIKNLVRMQDVTARLDTNLFAIAFPGQSAEDLKPVSERLSNILSCASVTDPMTGKALGLSLEISLNTLDEGERTYSAA